MKLIHAHFHYVLNTRDKNVHEQVSWYMEDSYITLRTNICIKNSKILTKTKRFLNDV